MRHFVASFALLSLFTIAAHAMCLPQYEYRTITLVEGQGVETPLGIFYVTTPGREGTVDRYGNERDAAAQNEHLNALCAERFGDDFEFANITTGTRRSQNAVEFVVDGWNFVTHPVGLNPVGHAGNTRHYVCSKLLPDPPVCNDEQHKLPPR